LALNQGRPHVADSLLRERRKGDTDESNFWSSVTLAAVFGEGIRETVAEIGPARTAWLAAHTAPAVARPNGMPGILGPEYVLALQALWDYDRGDTAAAATAVRWLGDHEHARQGAMVGMLLATDEKRANASALRARVDTAARDGCCRSSPVYVNLALARAFEHAGDYRSALRALRRRRDGTFFLASFLRQEGDVAYRLKDYAGAQRAYEQYLVLRSDPEPALRAERDSIRKLVDQLRRAR
jgi:hypothetical protein